MYVLPRRRVQARARLMTEGALSAERHERTSSCCKSARSQRSRERASPRRARVMRQHATSRRLSTAPCTARSGWIVVSGLSGDSRKPVRSARTLGARPRLLSAEAPAGNRTTSPSSGRATAPDGMAIQVRADVYGGTGRAGPATQQTWERNADRLRFEPTRAEAQLWEAVRKRVAGHAFESRVRTGYTSTRVHTHGGGRGGGMLRPHWRWNGSVCPACTCQVQEGECDCDSCHRDEGSPQERAETRTGQHRRGSESKAEGPDHDGRIAD